MLIATLEDGRTIMDVSGMKAYLVSFLGDSIIDVDHQNASSIMRVFIELSSGPRENAVERLVDFLFDADGPTSAAYAVYKNIFDFEVRRIGDYYYLSRSD